MLLRKLSSAESLLFEACASLFTSPVSCHWSEDRILDNNVDNRVAMKLLQNKSNFFLMHFRLKYYENNFIYKKCVATTI